MATISVPDLQIRPVSPSDLEEISQLEELCFKDPYPPYFLSQLAEANPETFMVAILDRRVVGYAVTDKWSDHDHLVSIAVHPDSRRRGIGNRLLLALEERLDKRKPLRLEVRRSNLPALNFYRRSNFHEIGVVDGYYSDGEDAILMEKKVPPQ